MRYEHFGGFTSLGTILDTGVGTATKIICKYDTSINITLFPTPQSTELYLPPIFFRKGKGGTGFRIIINDTPILIPHPISTTFPDKCCLANEVGNAITWAIYTRRTDKFIESRNSASLSQIRVAWFVESGLSHERINV